MTGRSLPAPVRAGAVSSVVAIRPAEGTAAGLLCAFAGLAHVAVVPEHLSDGWVVGAFFLALGLVQLAGAGFLLWHPTRGVASAVVAVSAAVIVLYVVSRTVGVPLGADHHAYDPSGRESVGALDLSTTLAEVALVVVLVPRLGEARRRLTVDGLLVAGLVLWVLRATGNLG